VCCLAPLGCRRGRRHRGDAHSRRGFGRGHQRPVAKGGEAAMTDQRTAVTLSPSLIDRLRAIVGREHALTDADQQLPYLREWRELYAGRAGVVLRPGSTEEVARIMAIAHAHAIPVVPQ